MDISAHDTDMSFWTSWHQNRDDIKPFVDCLGTISTAVFAFIAVSTWRRQLKGTTRFNSATRLLFLTNRVRDQIIAERGNPAPLHCYDARPLHDADNISVIETHLANERAYLIDQIGICETMAKEIAETVPSVDGILSDDVPALTEGLRVCLGRWESALSVRYNLIDNCSQLRSYDELVGKDSRNPILVLDEREESREFEESLRKAALQIAKAMQKYL